MRKRFQLSPKLEEQLLRMSARQMDRRLQARKRRLKRRLYGRTKPGALLKHPIPIQAGPWQEQMPGFTEVDLVSHSGNSASGEFAYSLSLIDLYTTWTETRAVLGRGLEGVVKALEEIRTALPFRLWGLDSDNGSEFINWHVGAGVHDMRCGSHAAGASFGQVNVYPPQRRRNGRVASLNAVYSAFRK